MDPSGIGRKLDEVEQFRVESAGLLRWQLLMLAVPAVLAIVGLLFILPIWSFNLTLVTLFLAGGIYAAHLRRVSRAFKEALMPDLLARVDPGLDRFDPEGMPEEQFRAMRLFKKPDKYESKDLISGWIGDTAVAFAMVEALEDRGKSYGTLFEGLVFVADFNKYFHVRTQVKAGEAGTLASMSDDHVELEDPRFDRAFAVTSSDQVEARYILTPALCERLLALKQEYRSLDAVFEESHVALALGASYQLLDPIVSDGIAADDFEKVADSLKGVVAIVEHLKLNTRIWSKKPEAA